MKKIILLVLAFCLCGCANVQDLSIDETIKTLTYKQGHINTYRTGYKYSLPRNLQIKSSSPYNEVLTSDKYIYYLYVDMVSYYNKTQIGYKESSSSFYSRKIEYDGKYGYVEINLKENNKYLIEIMYNYAKIEVMVDMDDINKTMLYAINILRNIAYNDNVIANLLGDDILNYTEEDYNIFNTTSSDSNYLNYNNEYVESEKEYDSDLLK